LEYISLQKDIDEVRDFIKIMGDKLKVTIDTKDLSDEEKNRITTLLKEIESIKNGHSERAAD
jgi:deoxyribose-phosphate aldolase